MSFNKVPGTENLYIGNVVSLRAGAARKKANIEYILSVINEAAEPDPYGEFEGEHLQVWVKDYDWEDILQHFPKCVNFIRSGLDSDVGVLVHCMSGYSRSAAVVIAYMISEDHDLTPEAALKRLREARPKVQPNDGFMEQLQLWHEMRATDEPSEHPVYERWLYKCHVERSVEDGRAPTEIRFEDKENWPLGASSGLLTVRCRKCRKILANSRYIIPHELKPPSATQAAQNAVTSEPVPDAPGNSSGNSSAAAPAHCAHIFVEALSWMANELRKGSLKGRLACDKCKSQVGKYAWAGMECSCGKWVTPAHCLLKSRVDEVRPALSVALPGGERSVGGS